MKQQLDVLTKELCKAQEQNQYLEKQNANSEERVQKYKEERDELELECDKALKVAEELKTSTSASQFLSEFSLSEIHEATNHFDPSLMIGGGYYGSIYKGNLRHTQVAIKKLENRFDFQHEVSVLSKLRHPNIITLIGAHEEALVLVFEYLPNGTLEDRLNCQDNIPPLSWQTRIRIAAELCSVLIFLHSYSNPLGYLDLSNILLDANYISKLWDFRSYSYEHTPESDVYSFGIILLRLLTGKSGSRIIKEVEGAYEAGELKDLLDPTAGDWPFMEAKQLACLAMRCCEMDTTKRPDLATEAYNVLENMKASCVVSSTRLSSMEPHYFCCPISQAVMEDPHVAADGFTYELEALREWLDSGHNTSPMTNLQLPHHNLVPNRALRSAIQEWQQKK